MLCTCILLLASATQGVQAPPAGASARALLEAAHDQAWREEHHDEARALLDLALERASGPTSTPAESVELLRELADLTHDLGAVWGDLDLYRMGVANGALTKVLASAPEGSLTVVPELVSVSGARWSRWHRTEGYIYNLGEIGSGGLLLFDADLDGTLDGIEVPPSVEFRARGLHQALDYLAFH